MHVYIYVCMYVYIYIHIYVYLCVPVEIYMSFHHYMYCYSEERGAQRYTYHVWLSSSVVCLMMHQKYKNGLNSWNVYVYMYMPNIMPFYERQLQSLLPIWPSSDRKNNCNLPTLDYICIANQKKPPVVLNDPHVHCHCKNVFINVVCIQSMLSVF